MPALRSTNWCAGWWRTPRPIADGGLGQSAWGIGWGRDERGGAGVWARASEPHAAALSHARPDVAYCAASATPTVPGTYRPATAAWPRHRRFGTPARFGGRLRHRRRSARAGGARLGQGRP